MSSVPATPALSRPRSARSGFTLIELMVVILILGLLVVVILVAMGGIFGKGQVKATEQTFETIGSTLRSEWQALQNNILKPQTLANNYKSELNTAAGLGGGTDYTRLTAEQRSIVLALLLATPGATLDRHAKNASVGRNPRIREEAARSFVKVDDKGIPRLLDAWESPISYDLVVNSGSATGASAQESAPFVLRSAGPDKTFDTDDDLNWSPGRKHYRGKWDPK